MDTQPEFDNRTAAYVEAAVYIIRSRGAHNIHFIRIGRYKGLSLYTESGVEVYHGAELSCGSDSSNTRGSIAVAKEAGFTGNYEEVILNNNQVTLEK